MKRMYELMEQIIKFRKERDWEQFHNPKDLAISLSLEASELLEIFQWKNVAEMNFEEGSETKLMIEEELADILNYILLISHDLNIDLGDALARKIEKNNLKYPVQKSKGVATKYNKL